MESSATSTLRRIGSNVVPVSYNLEYTRIDYWKEFTFDGTVTIDAAVQSCTSEFNVNSRDLTIHSVTVNGSSADFSLDEKPDILDIKARETMQAGTKATVQIKFSGILNNDMAGFYRSQTVNGNGDTAYVASTQFEATDARRAFPCWDEPAFKATLSLTLIGLASDQVLANTRELTTVTLDKVNDPKGPGGALLKRVTFEPLKTHSSYLFAWCIGPFEYIEQESKGIRYRVFTQIGKKKLAPFALKWAIASLEKLADFYQEPYPLSKMDLVAIPEFAAGAMENTGLVLYRESALLIDSEKSSLSNRIGVAYTISHENTHQWAGNIVSPAWWNNLWLNEAHATWIGNWVVNEIEPSFNIMDLFLVRHVTRGLSLDALASSHPVEVDVEDPADINSIFDSISYNKGASVLAMMWNYIGASQATKGERLFVQKFKYDIATSVDFWNCLSNEIDVKDFMEAWTSQTGYPVVSVTFGETVTDSNGDEKLTLKLTQQRFFSSPRAVDTDKCLWKIPINYSRSDGSSSEYALFPNTKSFTLLVDPNFLKLNAGQHGFYRVLYPESHWDKLIAAVPNMSVGDKFGLINDSFALASSGLIPTSVFLKVTLAFKDETNFTIWNEIATSCVSILNVFDSHIPQEKQSQYLNLLFSKIYSTLGKEISESDSGETKSLRSLIISILGLGAKNSEIIEWGKSQFDSFYTLFTAALKAENKKQAVEESLECLPASLRPVILKLAFVNNPTKVFDQLTTLFDQTDFHTLRLEILSTIACGPTVELIHKAIEWGKSAAKTQDFYYIFSGLYNNPVINPAPVLWNWISSNWDYLDDRYGKGGFLLGHFVSLSALKFSSDEDADRVEAFFKNIDLKHSRASLRQALERVRVKASWIQSSKTAVTEFFNSL